MVTMGIMSVIPLLVPTNQMQLQVICKYYVSCLCFGCLLNAIHWNIDVHVHAWKLHGECKHDHAPQLYVKLSLNTFIMYLLDCIIC